MFGNASKIGESLHIQSGVRREGLGTLLTGPRCDLPAPSADPQTAPPQVKQLPPYHVILLDDDDHTYEYVIEMLHRLFHIQRERAYRMASEVDITGRVIVYTGPLEQAELKQDQIHSYGRDPRLERSVGSMSAIIEPAE